MRDHLNFFLNGQPASISGPDAWLMLSEFLRKRRSLPGTKVVCAEGDCGSCTVLVGRVEDGKIIYRSVTSCITQVYQLDATHVVTVEGLKVNGELNPFQESLVRCQGSQCGFCTPGFVVAMQELTQGGQTLDAHAIRRGFTGNLCRCTGYDAIVRAALDANCVGMPDLDTLYPPHDMLAALTPANNEPVLLADNNRLFFKPVTVEQATGFLREQSEAGVNPVVLGGGTDLGVLQNKGKLTPDVIMHTAGLAELNGVTTEPLTLVVGGAASLSAFGSAVAKDLPELAEFLGWFGSPPIRNAGTLAGNLCTASPIGDTPPALYVLGAEVEIASPNDRRRLSIEDFQTGYRTTQLRPDEIVVRIYIPLLEPDEHLRLYKVSKRKDLDISSVSAAFRFRLNGHVIDRVNIAFGGVGPHVLRLTAVENLLNSKPVTRDLFEKAASLAAETVSPMSDVRGSEAYRRTLSRNALLKLWHEIDGGRFNGTHLNTQPPPTTLSPSTESRG